MLDCHGAGDGAPRCSEGYVGLSRRRRRRASPLGRLCWMITVQATALLATRKVILDCHGAGDGAPRGSEGYVGLSRRSRQCSSRLGRLCWVVTAHPSALLAARKGMLDCHGALKTLNLSSCLVMSVLLNIVTRDEKRGGRPNW
jgi:hypothetical protein